jgi:membrane fusion protein, heavy metal efflux system
MASSSAAGSAVRRPAGWRKVVQVTANWVVLVAIVVGVGYFLRTRAQQQATPVAETEEPPARLSDRFPDTLEVARQTIEEMRVQVAAVKPAPPSAPLKLLGSLYLEGSRLVHVQTVFLGRVVEVGKITEGGQARALRPGDRVEEGQVLAKLWSKEVGEKKSALVDAISDLYLHESVLKRLQMLSGGSVPLARLQEAEQQVRSDRIKIETLKRTLLSWQIPEEELRRIEAEADRVIQESLAKDKPADQRAPAPSSANPPLEPIRPSPQLALDRTWAELDILAPMTGIILEKNFTVGDIIDATQDMFKIADLSRLGVMAKVYEEDLPKLVALPPEQRRWEVELLAEPGLPPRQGRFESIGNVIDTAEHTAVVKGWLDNPGGELRVGQFVTALVELPNRPGLVMVPISSLVDSGDRAYVFVAHDTSMTTLTRREVKISRRGAVMALLESHPEPRASAQPLEIGELVVTSGVMELAGQYQTLQSQHPVVARVSATDSSSDDSESRP